MKPMLFALPFFAALPLTAIAQTQEQKNILQNAAVLTTANRWCSGEYVVQLDVVSRAMLSAGIDLEREPYRSYLRGRMSESNEAIAKPGIARGCAVIYDMYGPQGTQVRGQMMRR